MAGPRRHCNRRRRDVERQPGRKAARHQRRPPGLADPNPDRIRPAPVSAAAGPLLYLDPRSGPNGGACVEPPSNLRFDAPALGQRVRPVFGGGVDPELEPLPGQSVSLEQSRAPQQ